MGALRRAPGPTWLAYIVLQVVALGVAGIEGILSTTGLLDANQLIYGFFFITPLAGLHYLDHVAGQAWDGFRPVTDLDDRAAARVRYELTVTPARTGWVLLAFGFVLNTGWYFVDPVGIGVAGQPLPFIVARALVEGFLAGTLFVLLAQVVRQLRLIDRLHDNATRIDLLRPRSVQAMSRLTAQSSIAIVVLAAAIGSTGAGCLLPDHAAHLAAVLGADAGPGRSGFLLAAARVA
jgi:hypothetical protein